MTTKSVLNTHVRRYDFSQVQASNPNPGYNFIPTRVYATTVNLRTTNPDTVPGYKARIASGIYAGTDLDGYKIKVRSAEGMYNLLTKHKTTPNLWNRSAVMGSGYLGTDLSLVDEADQGLQQEALRRFLNQYRSNITQFQGGVFAAEIRQAISLITRPGRIVRKALDGYYDDAKRLAKRRKMSIRARNRELANEWLGFKFGIMPLLQDIEDASLALANVVANRRLRAKIKGTAKRRSTSPFEVFGGASFGNLRLDYEAASESLLQYTYLGQMWLDTGTPTAAISSAGFAPENWLPTIYELIPYSFVIDYFTNLGDVINAFSYGTHQISWSILTRRNVVTRTRKSSNPRNGNTSFYNDVSLSASYPSQTVVTAQRVVRAASPSLVPSIQFRIPGIGSTRWINLAALVAQRDRASHHRT